MAADRAPRSQAALSARSVVVDVELGPVSPGAAAGGRLVSGREGFVDVFRGLLIAHMALDHASLFFNAGRGEEELAVAMPEPAHDFFQFMTRFTGIPVAPAFFFMAGYMVAATSSARAARGVADGEVTRRLITRGLVLLAADAVVMGLPRAAMGFYSFMVLSSVGVSLVALAFLRRLPSRVLLPAALAVLCLHPLLDVSGLPTALRAVIYEPVRAGAFRSMYPVLPWGAIVLTGFVVGRDAQTRPQPVRLWLGLAAACLSVFFAVRLWGGYGNAYPSSRILTVEFWMFSKYPPDLPFVAWSFAWIFASLAALKALSAGGSPAWLAPFAVFGRVPFFFYMAHFWVLGIAAGIARTKLSLGGTYAIWLLLLLAMLAPCAWYFRKKTDRPNWFTRYV